jgi:transcriptional regulator with XRE-family HTH domain
MDSRHYYNQKLIDARQLRGKSQQEIADAVKVDRQTIYRAESGKNASYDLLADLCRLYEIPMTNIIIARPEPKPLPATV